MTNTNQDNIKGTNLYVHSEKVVKKKGNIYEELKKLKRRIKILETEMENCKKW